MVEKRSSSVANGKAIADRPRQRDNFRTEVGQGAAKGSQITLKDDSGAKIPKGPKIKEKTSNYIGLNLQKKPKNQI